MSTKSQPLVGEDYRLSLMDEAVVLYHTQKQDFVWLQDYYLNCPHGEERYYWSAPNYMLMAEVLEDDEGRYWKIAYASSRDPRKTMEVFFDLAPFPLDRVLFTRYHRMNNPNSEKFFSWDSLKRISNYGIIKTKTTTTSSTTTRTASPSCANGSETSKAGGCTKH